MPLFSRFKSKGGQSAAKNKGQNVIGNGASASQKPRWQSSWASKTIELDEIEELVHMCTAEMKSRAEALDAPFLLLPFRPHTDAGHTPTFIQNFYTANSQGSDQYKGARLQQELRLTESVVLCSIIKWCWSRIPGGVVTWAAYEGFKIGEQESNMDRMAFDTFIPISVDSPARKSIVFDFFDLLAAVAAHGKNNGLGGRKLSRLAGWWAFEHVDQGTGFEGGYKLWTAAADACSHLFFAYLRALSPEANPAMSLIERIPRALQALLASTEYPPETPSLMQRTTPRVVMVVDHVSPTPFALLRRAKHFEYRDQDRVLREYQEFEDPIDALTEECKRVLLAISSANSRHATSSHGTSSKPEESWSAFQNAGFRELEDKPAEVTPSVLSKPASPTASALTTEPRSRNADFGRPTTPSWADFMSSGFADDAAKQSQARLMLPPDKVLPPIANRAPTPSRSIMGDESLAPGELAAITNVELDDAFWWVWMTSLANEEPANRKAVFGRCALVESTIMNGKWLIMEEQVKGAAPDPAEDAYIAPKRSLFASLTKRGRLGRKRSSSKKGLSPSIQTLDRNNPALTSRSSLAPDQHSRIKAAAAALAAKPSGEKADELHSKRGRLDDSAATKTNSTLTMGMMSEASPALKWASAYDKKAIRAQYLGDEFAGKGMSREELSRSNSANDESRPELSKIMEPNSPPQPAANDDQRKLENSKTTVAAPQEKISPPVNNTLVAARVSSLESKPAETTGSLETKPASPEVARRAPVVDTASATTSKLPVVGRKAVGSPKHPALREGSIEDDYEAAPAPVIARKASSPNVSRSAAALAAAKAMQTADGPESPSRLKKQSSASGGFKKMFGSRREPDRAPMNNASPVSDNGIGRRISQLRKKPVGAGDGVNYPVAAAAAVTAAAAPARETSHDAYYNRSYDDHDDESDDAREEAAARREFSRFDQGPMADMPAVAPQTPSDDGRRKVSSSYSHTNEISHEFESKGVIEPEHFEQEKGDSRISEEPEDTISERDSYAPAAQDSQADRWAAIRENAAKRSATRASEEQSYQSHQSRPSQGGRTDDGETSGEETIESRVARIKARVAELTGGLDQGANNARR